MLGYTFRHQLVVTVVLLAFFCTLIHIIWFSVIYLSCCLVILWLQFILLLFMHTVYMHEFSSLHTHSPGRFLTTLDLHVQILDALFLSCRCSMRPYILQGAWVSLILVFSSLLYSCYFLILPLSHSAAIFFPLFICYHCDILYMYYCSDFDL